MRSWRLGEEESGRLEEDSGGSSRRKSSKLMYGVVVVRLRLLYEYPVSAAQQPNTQQPQPQSQPPTNEYREIPIQSRNHPREIPAQTQPPAEKPAREDWRGPWPHDNLGPKPRLVGGKLVKPKFIDY